jgi:type III secretory pathway component EscV
MLKNDIIKNMNKQKKWLFIAAIILLLLGLYLGFLDNGPM